MSLKIQTPLLISSKTTDEPVAPSGFGEIFASGSKLYFRSDSGSGVTVSQNLTRSGSVVVNEYTSSGFWVKPNNIAEIYVLCIAGGGGAGSGRVSSASIAASGGGGGTGGSITARRFKPTALTAVSYSITVGTGGAGGGSQTTNSTNGRNGSAGTASSFAISGSTILVGSVGGNAGSGGNTLFGAAAVTLTPTAATPNVYPYAMGAFAAGAGSTSIGENGNNGFIGRQTTEDGNASGAGGGGISAANVAGNGGFNGIVYVIEGGPTGSSFQGTVASPDCPSSLTSGSNLKRDLLHFPSSRLTRFGVGLSGGGGAGSTGSNAGSGSGGGNYGAGAGGGGGARNGFSSGPGGKGGDGLVYIVEYYY